MEVQPKDTSRDIFMLALLKVLFVLWLAAV
jgi:hypothetical protein